ncbi:MAG: CBS domain-containing protein, partial [Lactobacillus sp.]|nr:CBS domain-containing protein [Lactobacillus sp.]
RFTRYPVVQNNDKDHVIGYIFSYDIMRQNQINPKSSIREIIRKIPVVYEGETLTDVLRKMMRKQAPIAVVQDEYGGTSGIVTDKDIYEEMFGNVREEIDHVSADMIEKQGTDNKGNQVYKVSGKTPLSDFERYFKVDIPQFEDKDVATLTGYFLEEEYPLKVNRPIRLGNFSFIPTEVQNEYVSEFKVIQIQKPTKKQDQNDDQK